MKVSCTSIARPPRQNTDSRVPGGVLGVAYLRTHLSKRKGDGPDDILNEKRIELMR